MRAVTRSLGEAVLAVDLDGCLTFANPAFELQFGWTQAELRGTAVEPRLGVELVGRVLTEKRTVRLDEITLRRFDDSTFIAVCVASPIVERGHIIGVCVAVSDVTEQRRAAALLTSENRMLERIAAGHPLPAVLDDLAGAVEASATGLRVVLRLLSPDGTTVEHTAAPSLPPDVTNALDGATASPRVEAPAPLSVPGESDAWRAFSDMALQHDLRGGFTTPIIGEGQRLLGVLSAYTPRLQVPSPDDLELLAMAAHVARVAIERQRADEQRQREIAQERRNLEHSEAARAGLDRILSSISDAFACLDREWRYTHVNDRYTDMVSGGARRVSARLWDDLPRALGTDLQLELEYAVRAAVPVQLEVWSDDLRRWLEVRAYPLEDGLMISLLDIGGRKALEQARDALYLQLEEERARLAAVLQQMPVGVLICDVRGRTVAENRWGVEMLGEAVRSGAVDLSHLLRLSDAAPYPQEHSPLHRALAGERVLGEEALRLLPDGRRVVLRLDATPLRDARSAVVGGVLTIHDITAQKRQEERDRFLADVSRDLAASLRRERLLGNVMRALTHHACDWCVVDVMDAEGRMADFTLAHVDPVKEERLRALRAGFRFPRDSAPVVAVRERRTVHNADTLPELQRRGNLPEAVLHEMAALGLGSTVSSPLIARNQVLGALTVASARVGAFTADDCAFIEDLAARIALSLDNSRLYRAEQAARLELDALYARERDLVKAIGTSFLGVPPSDAPRLDVAAGHRFALEANRVGGDYHDFIAFEDGRLAVVVGDVCGKGIEAAIFTAAAKYQLRAYALEDPTPAVVARRLNRSLCREMGECGLFVTLVYALVDAEAGTVTWVNAGHPPPVLHDPTLGTSLRLDATGGILGGDAEFMFTQGTLPFPPSAVLALFTDGVCEAAGILDPTGDGGVSEILTAAVGCDAARLVERIMARTVADAGGRPRDDVAIAVVRHRA